MEIEYKQNKHTHKLVRVKPHRVSDIVSTLLLCGYYDIKVIER